MMIEISVEPMEILVQGGLANLLQESTLQSNEDYQAYKFLWQKTLVIVFNIFDTKWTSCFN